MRVVKVPVIFVALHVLCACSLDFDQFGKPGQRGNMDGGSGDGGVAQPGDPCSGEGSRACKGHASRQTLVCRSGKWQAGETCSSDQRCDSRDGADLGRCVAIPSQCTGKNANEPFCVTDTLRTCNLDLVAFDDVVCGAFGSCMQSASGAQCTCATGHAHASDGSCSSTAGDGGGGSGGSHGSGGSSPPKDKPPVVSLVFPPPGLTDRASITVRGTVSDPDGDAITKLTVNGKAAKLNANGSFSVSAPLMLGKHTLALHVEDDGGAKDDSDGPEIERLAYMFEDAVDMLLDSANNRVIALDGANDAIVAISLADGSRKVIVAASSTPVGRNGMDLDAANHRLIVTEQSPGALAWIDLNTGKRTVISDASHGTGTGMAASMVPHTVVLDPVMTGRAFVSADGNDDTFSSNIVLAVDLTTGDRTKYSQPGTYPNINFGNGYDLIYDQARSQLLMLNSAGVMTVKIANDASAGTLATLVSATNRANAVGYGAPLFNPWRMSLDGDRLIIVGSEDIGSAPPCVFEVDMISGRVHELAALGLGNDPRPPSLSNTWHPGLLEPSSGDEIVLDPTGTLLRARLTPGDREYLSDALYGGGPLFGRPISVVEDATRKRWIVADQDLKALVAVDKGSGDRTLVSDTSHGSGSDFGTLVTVAVHVDQNNDEIIALDDTHVWSVDPISGDRRVISGDSMAFGGATDLVVDNTRALVTGCFGPYPCAPQVIAVDLANGNRSVVSDMATGSGPLPGSTTALTGIVARNGKFLVTGPDMLLELDASNGNRTALSDGSNGSGDALTSVHGLGLDTYEDRALVVSNSTLVAIDLQRGDRSPLTDLSDAAQGPSTTFLSDLIADTNTHRLIVAEGWGGTDAGLVAVHLADRKRTLISEQGRGDWNAAAIVLDPAKHLLYAGQYTPTDTSAGATVVSVDTRTSKLATISDDSDNGGSVRWTVPVGLALDTDGNRLFGINFFYVMPNSLLAISLATGKQTVVSDTNKGSGVAWTAPFDLEWDAAHSRALIANPALPAIVAVDPKSGDRVAFSGGPAGSGAVFVRPSSLAVDEADNRLLVIDPPEVVAVDLETGARTPFSGASAGGGPDLVSPARVVVDAIGKRAIVLDIGGGSPVVAPTLVSIALDDGTRSVLATLPSRWYANSGFNGLLAGAFAFDGETEIAYVGALYAFDTTTGESIWIAGHVK